MSKILTGTITLALHPRLARSATWLDEWLPDAWNTEKGLLPDAQTNYPISQILAHLAHCSGKTDPERLFNTYTDPRGESREPGWLSVADPYFADRNLDIPVGAVVGYTVTLDEKLADLWATTVNAFFNELTFEFTDPSGASVNDSVVANASGLWFTGPNYEDLPINTVTDADATVTIAVTRTSDEKNAIAREAAVDQEDQQLTLGTAEVVDVSVNLDGSSTSEGRPTVKLYQAVKTTIRVPLRATDGSPLTVNDTFKAAVVYRSPQGMKSIATGGVIAGGYATFEDVVTGLSGMFECQLWITDTDSTVVKVLPMYVTVVPTGLCLAGVDIVNKVRARLMDDKRENNLLLGDYEFDTQDIIIAAQSAIDLYNATGRPSSLTMQSFPKAGTFVWEACTRGLLLQSAAYRYERNRMRHQAGDVALDDQDKAASYHSMAKPLIDDMRDYAATRKARMSINSSAAWGTY